MPPRPLYDDLGRPLPAIPQGPWQGSCRIQRLTSVLASSAARFAVVEEVREDRAAADAVVVLRPWRRIQTLGWELPLPALTRPFPGVHAAIAGLGPRDALEFWAEAARALRDTGMPIALEQVADRGVDRPKDLFDLVGEVPLDGHRPARRIAVGRRKPWDWRAHVLKHLVTPLTAPRGARRTEADDAEAGPETERETAALEHLFRSTPGLHVPLHLVKAAARYGNQASAPESPDLFGLTPWMWPLVECLASVTSLLAARLLDGGEAVHLAREDLIPLEANRLLAELQNLAGPDLRPGEELLVGAPLPGLQLVARGNAGLANTLPWRTSYAADAPAVASRMVRLRRAAGRPGLAGCWRT